MAKTKITLEDRIERMRKIINPQTSPLPNLAEAIKRMAKKR